MADYLAERSTGSIEVKIRGERYSSFCWTTNVKEFPTKECIISPLFDCMDNTWQLRLHRKGIDGSKRFVYLELLRLRPSKSRVTWMTQLNFSGKERNVNLLKKFDVQSCSCSMSFSWTEMLYVYDYICMIISCNIWTEELPSQTEAETFGDGRGSSACAIAEYLAERSTGKIEVNFSHERSSSFSWVTNLNEFRTKECITSPLFNGMHNTWQLRLHRNGIDGRNPCVGLELLRRLPSKGPVKFVRGISISGTKECVVDLPKEFDVESCSFNTDTEIQWFELLRLDNIIIQCLIWTEELPKTEAQTFGYRRGSYAHAMAEVLAERSSGRIEVNFSHERSSSFCWVTIPNEIQTKECITSPLFNGMHNTWQLSLRRNGVDGRNRCVGLELLRSRPSKGPVKFVSCISNSGRKECIVELPREFDVQNCSLNTNTDFNWFELLRLDKIIIHCLIWTEELPSKTENEFLTEQSNAPEREENVENFVTKVDFNLHKHLKDLRLTGDDHVVLIKVRNREFRAHKNILSVRSPVFAAMFKHEMKENKDNSVSIDDCDPEAFDEFLNYVYTGRVENISPEKATGLYYAGEKYDFSELKKLCVQFLQSSLSITSICDVIDLARIHGENGLLKSAIKFFSENIDQILETVEWQRFRAKNFVVANELTIKAMKTFQDKKA